MPKPSKKAPIATRPISDFFPRKMAIASQPVPKASAAQSTTPKSTKAGVLSPGKSVSSTSASLPSATKSNITVSDASSPATPCNNTIFVDTVEIASPNRSAMENQHLKPPALPTFKRARSGSLKSGSLSPHPIPARSRKTLFDSDSDVEMPAPSVYALRSPARPTSNPRSDITSYVPFRATEILTPTSQTRTQSRKKQRLSSPQPDSELVPTSQSDELELAPTISSQLDPTQVKRNVDEWRHNAVSAPSCDLSSDSRSVSSVGSVDTPSRNSIVSVSPLPPSPPLLDPTTKAERIIAEIKARAYAESLRNRPETPVREFKDELSDSDDDDLFPTSPMKGKGKNVTSVAEPQRRYGLRQRETSLPPSSPNNASSSSALRVALSAHTPTILTNQKPKGKGKSYNPLDELLKEKKRDDERGKGSKAFRQAEAALADRDAIMAHEDDVDFTNEAAARQAVTECRGLSPWPSSPGQCDGNEDVVNDNDRNRLLGTEHGMAVARLLNRDKASRLREKEIEKPIGIPLWRMDEVSHRPMDVDQAALPKLEISTPHPLLSVLQECQDIEQVALLVGSGVFSSSQFANNSVIIPYLCDLALNLVGIASNSAIQALSHIWRTSLCPVPGISFACIVATLTRLGAQTTVLDAMGWTPSTITTFSRPQNREPVLYLLVSLIVTSARHRRLSNEEIPDLLMSIILIANDPLCSPELHGEIALAVDAVCASIASGGDLCALTEASICNKVLTYLSTLEPINKAHITAIFGSGCGRTRRIGRWIAHAVLTDKTTVSPKRYSALPLILPLVEEFTRQRTENSSTYGKFVQRDTTDFVDMTLYVRILGVAVTNIVGYVMEEGRTHSRQSGSRDEQQPLVLLRTAIEGLHGRISDIRATHLDRSQAKAALKELSLRIHYQRLIAQQSRSTIKSYFSKHKKPSGTSS